MPDSLVVFYDEVKEFMDKGKTADVVYLDLCKVIDTLPSSTLVSKKERHEWTTQWVRTWLGDHTDGQMVSI